MAAPLDTAPFAGPSRCDVPRERISRATVALACLVGALTIGAFALLAWLHRTFTVDDAFITMRYSANVAAGAGPTWNPGGGPVEGYTTCLWMLVLVVPHLLGADALVFAKVAGAVCMLATVGGAGALAAALAGNVSRTARVAAAAVAVVLVGTSTSTAVHAISGMETALFTLLVTALFLVTVRWCASPDAGRLHVALALLALAAGLTRPEGNLVAGVTFATALATVAPPHRRRLATVLALGWVLPYATYFAWRYAYYGMLVPLSFYVKAANEPGILRGADEVLGFVKMLFVDMPHVGAGLAVCAFARRRPVAPVAAGALSLLAFFLLPAPIMAYESRYLFPVLPSLFAMSAGGVAIAIDALARKTRRAEVTFAVAAMLLFSALGARRLATHARPSIAAWTGYGAGIERAHVRLAHDLRARSSEGLVALVDVGAVAYYSGWRTLDTFGLNDAYIARTGRRDAAYVREQNPDVVVFLSQHADRFTPHLDWEKGIYDDFVAQGYVPFTTYAFAPDYFLLALARPEP